MKRLLNLLLLTASLLAPRAARAVDPFGSVAATYTYSASKILADPARTRVYITDTASNSVVVIDTTTLKVTATVPVGSDPVDMAISPDGNTLFVANGGSTLAAIALLDLNTLAVRTTFPLASAPQAIAAGNGGRLYVSAGDGNFSNNIYQLDSTTGAVQTSVSENSDDYDLLTLSPNGNTLFAANNDAEPGDLVSFDVSTAMPVAAQSHTFFSTFPPQLVVSHTGKYVCLPSYSSVTYLYATADITTYYGSFTSQEGYGAGPLAFSPDDSLVYQINNDGSNLDVFSTASFTQVNTALVPSSGQAGYPVNFNQVVIDNTGSYLFLGGKSSYDYTGATGQLTVVTTGAGTLTPPSVVPTITGSLSVTGTQGTAFTYQIAATGAPTSYGATDLPAGLSLNPATGVISGTPTGYGDYEFQVSATVIIYLTHTASDGKVFA